MPNPTMRHSLIVRPAVVALLAVAVVATSGCSWFRKGDKNYRQSAENRPLEVPPDLDRPNTEGAMQSPAQPQSVSRSSMPVPAALPSVEAAAGSGFTVAGERDDIFARVGVALAATDGVSIASKAQLLGTYDISYAGSNFLVRVTKVESGVYVAAVDPRGMPATDAAAIKVIAALKAALGVN